MNKEKSLKTTALNFVRDNNKDLRVATILSVKANNGREKSKRMEELSIQVVEKLGAKSFRTKIQESVACTEV